MSMRGRESKVPPAADLMVCFPPRAHLSLLPKPICSPARTSDQQSTRHHHHRGHYRRKSINRSHASPLLWAKPKPQNSDVSEPTSPKVTCAGQIKVRPKPNACKNWQSVMEEIERIHNNRKKKKRSAWIETLGFKKDVTQFLTCLRNIRFDFRCFGAFPTAGITSDDEDDEDDEEEDENYRKSGSKEASVEETDRNSGDVFSKWFMILQENQGKEYFINDLKREKTVIPCIAADDEDDDGDAPTRPPPNALLLMRCRSAPAKGLTEGNAAAGNQSMVLMNYGAEFSEISGDIAKETWIEGGIRDLLSRSRSWRR
ncbi:uncharacterized protein LOC127248228 [Andrographis paniculata]|uniref:uncharacterized protein LOC127248228 n=1 Tax=Andrographis paniculata TaxID=175694 RepID=UPI0021E6E5C3|nr:uncharacterized protein LOC127248228 [Andrographis paniculata]